MLSGTTPYPQIPRPKPLRLRPLHLPRIAIVIVMQTHIHPIQQSRSMRIKNCLLLIARLIAIKHRTRTKTPHIHCDHHRFAPRIGPMLRHQPQHLRKQPHMIPVVRYPPHPILRQIHLQKLTHTVPKRVRPRVKTRIRTLSQIHHIAIPKSRIQLRRHGRKFRALLPIQARTHIPKIGRKKHNHTHQESQQHFRGDILHPSHL